MRISEPAEYAILGLLKIQPMHGYEMFQYFADGALGQIVHLEMSQLYAFCKKLERLHYIEAQLESQHARPSRKVFHLTSTGCDVLLNWLAQPVERPRDIRILFLLKLFFVRYFFPERLADLIALQIAAYQSYLVQLESRQHRTSSSRDMMTDTAFLDQVVLSSRIHQTRSLVEWLQGLRHDLELSGP